MPTFNLEPKDFTELQTEVYKWQVYNFGVPPASHLALGVCEEIGELCHAVLKMEQDIRGSKEKHLADIKDAVGDASIFLMNLCSSLDHKYKVPEKTTNYRNCDAARLALKCFHSVSFMAQYASDGYPDLAVNSTHVINISLIRLCQYFNWEFKEVVMETWKEVGKRNWKKFPKNGVDQ